MKRLLGLGAVFMVLAVCLWAYWMYTSGHDIGAKKVSVVIEEGDSFSQVARELSDGGVVRSLTALKVAARLRGVDRRLIPGRYDFTGENSMRSILDRLASGDIVRIRVTIPEGTPIWRVASILKSELQLDSAALIALNTDSAFLTEKELPCLEGYLFPETYFFPWGTSLTDVVSTMVALFRQQTEDIWPSEIQLGLSRRQIIVLASIIEAETRVDKERPLVASVYSNRLRKRWRLDADPTVIYGLGGLSRPLYRKDLKKDTPYNTYVHYGLPPTPINSPGLASIKAALDPADTDYFFFVADNTGGHYFSTTNAEHNRAIQRIRREQRQQNNN